MALTKIQPEMIDGIVSSLAGSKDFILTAGATNEIITPLTTLASGFKSIIVKYSADINTVKRTGTLHIASDGTNVAIADSFAETSPTGFSFSAAMASGNIEIRQTNTEIGPITISLDITRIKE